MTKIVGLTGGIGGGKTTVAHMFKLLGVPVFNSDEEAKVLIDESGLNVHSAVLLQEAADLVKKVLA